MKRLLPIFLAFFTLSFLIPEKVFAASSPIPKIGFPCNKTSPVEFSSLRPYQAAPCGTANLALYCSNDLIFTESFSNFPECTSQGPDGAGKFICSTSKFIPDHTLTVNLSNSQLPILGNTELTKNSQSSTDQIDNATKVSEYASWYLNGTLDRAEYGQNDPSKTVDYSGPIQKIMPQAILQAQRVSTITSASAAVTYSSISDNTGGATTIQSTTELQNHNQIVVCYDKQLTLLPSWLTNFFGIGAVGLGTASAKDCYDGNGHLTPGLSVLRLKSWDNTPFDLAIDSIRPFLSKLLSTNILGQLLNSAFVDRWSKKIPPLPWSDKNGKPFATSEAYKKAYNEWRGDICGYVPNPFGGSNILLCAGIPGVTNSDYADLFPFIPLANTVDKKGSINADFADIQPLGDTQIKDPSFNFPKSAPLWFAHTEEVKNLSSFLNTSYTPLDCKTVNGKQTCQPLQSVAVPLTTETNQCNVVNVRANPGDNLFPGQPHGIIVPNVHYTITQVPCEKKVEIFLVGKPPVRKIRFTVTCDAEIDITMPTTIQSPSANEIWQNTVAYSGSTFRKIYPKVEAGAPVSCIADIPASTGVTYTAIDNVPAGGNSEFNYNNPAVGSNNASELYFPHLGSVYDYFLKGIQTALRPKGYADPSPISGKYCSPEVPTECDQNVPDSAIPSKYLGTFKSNFIDLANRWTTDCPGSEYNLATQCYNYVVSEAQKAKINPAFVLTIWVEESDASNYCHSGSTTQDFGINIHSLYQNFTGQLQEFLKLPDKFSSCRSVPGWIEPMEAFLSRFQSHTGACDPADSVAAAYYVRIKDQAWQYVTGTKCIKNGKFAISWPTDNSCP